VSFIRALPGLLHFLGFAINCNNFVYCRWLYTGHLPRNW